MMQNLRTSTSHPLIIDAIAVANGAMGLTFCPGKIQPHSLTGGWNRDIQLDIAAMKHWGAQVVISLLEIQEYAELQATQLLTLYPEQFNWFNLPFADKCAPDEAWLAHWLLIRSQLQHLLRSQKILIHCKGGFGRTGTVAALLLMDQGFGAEEAIIRCRRARKYAVETPEQEYFVRNYVPLSN